MLGIKFLDLAPDGRRHIPHCRGGQFRVYVWRQRRHRFLPSDPNLQYTVSAVSNPFERVKPFIGMARRPF